MVWYWLKMLHNKTANTESLKKLWEGRREREGGERGERKDESDDSQKGDEMEGRDRVRKECGVWV